MMRQRRFESRVSLRVVAGVVSVALHLSVAALLILSGGHGDSVDNGEAPASQLVMLESATAAHRDGVELTPLEAALASADVQQLTDAGPPPSLSTDATDDEATLEPPLPPVTSVAPEFDAVVSDAVDPESTFTLPQAERLAFLQNLARLSEALAKAPQAQVTWNQDGRQYKAALILQRASDGLELDQAVAEVSAQDQGRQLTTRIRLKRLAFSHFTQMIDRWDPMVQLHDDEIIGRTHINSRFNVAYDTRTAPKFSGKLSTAARSFDTQSSGKRREADMFQGGIETQAGRIDLPRQIQPFEWTPREPNARVHEFSSDTRLRFFADGSYTWKNREVETAQYRNDPSSQPVYFIAARGTTLYVQGVVAGKILIYSPHRIVVEGSIKYAHDPRDSADSHDYVGLVSDRYIEVAPPYVTGRGDLEIHAGIFAGRRFVVTNIDYGRPATLRIYGSLTAGTVSASEPRYGMKIEYDTRFEKSRPPGFPSTNRYAAEDWDGRWTQTQDNRILQSKD